MRDRSRTAADLAVALAVAWTWLFTAASLNTYFPARIDRMVAFAADRPFMTRPLVPVVIRMASAVLPEAPVLPIGLPPSIELATLIVTAAFVGLAIYAARRLIRAVAPTSHPAESLIAWSAALALVVLTHGRNGLTFGIIYDPASLALTMLAVVFICERAWSSYVSVFAIAAVNRESAAFLIPIFALAAWPALGRRRLIELLALQIGAFVSIRDPAVQKLTLWPLGN